VDGVRFVWVRAALYKKNNWRRVWNMLSFVLNFLRVARLLQLTPDVVVGSSPHLFAPVGAWIVARRHGARFVLELRDLWPQALIDLTGSSEKRLSMRLMRIIEAFLYRKAHQIVVLATGSIRYLVNRGVAESKILYIPNGVHMRHFQSSDASGSTQERLHARDGFGFRRYTIVYTGAHGTANSLSTILKAAKLVAESRDRVEFVLVGDGPSKLELVRESESLGLTNVRFMDPVPKTAVSRLLDAADAAVITLRSAEAFSYAISPNKLFDYMAAGKPVLCAVEGDMANLVTQSGAGMAVPPENPEALAEAVLRLVQLPDHERQAMGHRGRELVQRDFSREALAIQLSQAMERNFR
jgi:glycosyltransferase involved in cell wall biosynthesis